MDKFVDTVSSVPFGEIWGWWSEREGLCEERYTSVRLTFWIVVYESISAMWIGHFCIAIETCF